MYTNNPLTYALTSTRLNATGHRWIAELSDFNFTVKYHPGTANRDADALTRMPFEQYISECKEKVEPEWIKATVAANAQRQGETVWFAALSSRPRGVKHIMDDTVTLQVQPITPKQLYQAQREDPAIGKVININKVADNQLCKTDREHLPTCDPSYVNGRSCWRRCWRRRNPSSHKWLKCTTCSSSKVS